MTGAPDADFARRTQPYRRELLAHCYRMLGSVHDAEDLVQETYLRAWRSYDGFQGRSSVRTWLYQIATNVCLTALRHRGRRVLPSGLGAPGADPYAEPVPAASSVRWLQPIPDALVAPDPAGVVVARDSLRLALIACLQHLNGRQRAVLLLRDVLGLPAAEVATILDTSVAAVKSTLQRARARLDEIASAAEQAVAPTEPAQRALLDEYMAAFQNSDAAALERLLHRDAVIEMPPAETWFAGKRTCAAFLAAQAIGAPGDWSMYPTSANGQPAAVAYHRETDGVYRAFGVAVLTTTADSIARITVFGDPGLVGMFGFPAVIDPAGAVAEDVALEEGPAGR
ncbi:RNA polymerase ECF family sigma subunit [Nocardia tenerifensis]|uniref:RNA polymerase sigma factor n=1 Tax=Nocardia tenerifensis TaxID=228006 RepID=A0A318KJS5_9NOCA|nr:sigma-70 family RNA polymerase sigma factor [Nocardia tenerifensis]PXX61536.1 RNA polymerase ECF family sigma subunit [Nocardia tenerifensis]